jgi:hypothetical protein
LAKSAETDVAKVTDWGGLHKAFLRYKSCDDGSIGESFSDRVTVLLSDKWDTLPQLGQLIAKDRAFAAFVIRHIDETSDPSNLQRITSNARQHGCPGLQKATCKRIHDQAEAAVKALQQSQKPPKK